MKLVALAYARAALAALDLAQDLSRRAGRLVDAAPKLRAKGKTGAIEALLDDDAVPAAAPITGLSDRARRRLFDRLVALGAARELTGRPTWINCFGAKSAIAYKFARALSGLLLISSLALAQEIHYSPEERLDAIDAALIATARSSIDLASYALTDSIVLDALNAAERQTTCGSSAVVRSCI